MHSIFIIGDSISIQYGPYLRDYLDGFMHYDRLAGDPGNLDDPEGANAGDSRRVLHLLDQLSDIDADWLLLNCGLHDLRTDPDTGAKQVPLDEYRRNLRAIIDRVDGMRPRLVWLRTTPVDEAIHNARQRGFQRFAADVDAYNAAADDVMQGVPTIDLYTITANLGPDLYLDHVHFQDAVRRQQAAFIAGWLAAQSPLS